MKRPGFTLLTIWLILLAAFLATGCGASSQSENPQDRLTGLTREGFDAYSSTFTVQFDGPTDWVYRLQLRKSASQREYNLHIEGVDRSFNPGDVRMVTDGATTWMSGAGTDNTCVQFPNNTGMDPEFILPETLTPMDQLVSLLKYVKDEPILAKTGEHWNGSGLTIGNWQNASVDVWIEKSGQTLLRWNLQASGDDPFFGAGAGTLKASYEVSDLSAPTIEPVTGCEIAVPLPDSAVKVVRLPGIASFETSASSKDIQTFYQTILPQEDWAEAEPPVQAAGVMALSYRRGAETVLIQIRSIEEGGSKVQLIFP